mmetsp:Transcript_39961/g.63968  ORF Transcript_39961/g.63968 Transcript_39961/m.63968 type:complete len:208 (+) Transcript_39961:2091-2714(+)
MNSCLVLPVELAITDRSACFEEGAINVGLAGFEGAGIETKAEILEVVQHKVLHVVGGIIIWIIQHIHKVFVNRASRRDDRCFFCVQLACIVGLHWVAANIAELMSPGLIGIDLVLPLQNGLDVLRRQYPIISVVGIVFVEVVGVRVQSEEHLKHEKGDLFRLRDAVRVVLLCEGDHFCDHHEAIPRIHVFVRWVWEICASAIRGELE